MSASHFFVGLGAGLALLTVPVLTVAPGLDLPGRFSTWVQGPPPQSARLTTDNAAVARPVRGYVPGDPTPTPPASPPTLQPVGIPTPAGQQRPPIISQPPPIGGTLRTGVIRSGGTPVFVRSAPGAETSADPQLADGSPVL